jgi:hypothetical protein
MRRVRAGGTDKREGSRPNSASSASTVVLRWTSYCWGGDADGLRLGGSRARWDTQARDASRGECAI